MTEAQTERGAVWMRGWLAAAGIYNLAWGAWVLLFPQSLFDWMGAVRPNYPEFWQCVGMMVGVFGVGYLIAARAPLRHWPIVLVGLLGKVLGPVGFLNALWHQRLPAAFGVVNLTNDLVWWIPFGMILLAAWRVRGGRGGKAG